MELKIRYLIVKLMITASWGRILKIPFDLCQLLRRWIPMISSWTLPVTVTSFAYTAPVMKIHSTAIFLSLGSWIFRIGKKGSMRIATSLMTLVSAAVSYMMVIFEGQPGNCNGLVPQLSEIGWHWKRVAKKMLIHQSSTYVAMAQIAVVKLR